MDLSSHCREIVPLGVMFACNDSHVNVIFRENKQDYSQQLSFSKFNFLEAIGCFIYCFAASSWGPKSQVYSSISSPSD
jgi:hypothetical protein